MRLNLLHLDGALKDQPLFLERCRSLNARETDASTAASALRLWGKDDAVERLRRALLPAFAPGGEMLVTFMGSGDFHHVSALLIGLLAESASEKLTVIHFDNHPDWVHFAGGMHCGSWVNKALSLPQVDKIVTIGPCSRDLVRPQLKKANLSALAQGKIALLPWQSPSARFAGNDIHALPQAHLLAKLDALVTTSNVYITIDKDVLPREDAITNWDQGGMPMTALLTVLRHLLAHRRVLGIDVTGDYSPPHYAGKTHHVALKKIEAWLDQPRRAPDAAQAAGINQQSNLALLDCIREAA